MQIQLFGIFTQSQLNADARFRSHNVVMELADTNISTHVQFV